MNNVQAGELMHSFRVVRVRHSEELCGDMVEMLHEKTGTRLCWLDNGIENKLFSITFRTLPEDDTGVFHILEHSTLCGSEQYPVKEPFVELLKGSMNTFLNAMTFPDKTMYPVSSRSEKDFLNLTKVYLDAVFAPRLLTDPNIFYQEGWHIELQEGVPSYKGVVFNEMKGAMGQVDEVMERGIMHLLFPDTCYGFNSGGEPSAIPTLTYEQYRSTYQKVYHPSNASIYLDGAVPLDETLALIDSYLQRFDAQPLTEKIKMQLPVSQEKTCDYAVGAEEPIENRSHLIIGSILTSWEDRVTILAAKVIADVLAGNNASPLTRAILDQGLAEDVDLSISDSVLQPYVTLTFRNVTDGKEQEIMDVVRSTVLEILETGLPSRAVLSSINHMEFLSREHDEPQGVIRAIQMQNAYLYGGDPLQYLEYNQDFQTLRAWAAEGKLEPIMKRMLLPDDGLCKLRLCPSKTLEQTLREQEAARLAQTVEAWTEEERQDQIRKNENLLAWQQAEDTPENLATLPQLHLGDVGDMAPSLPTQWIQDQPFVLRQHAAPTNGIIYLNFYFRLTDIAMHDLPTVALVTKMLMQLPTEHYDVLSLQEEIKMHLGEMYFGTKVYAPKDSLTQCAPYLVAHVSVLEGNVAKAVELCSEVLLRTRFDDAALVQEVLQQVDETARQIGANSGHAVALARIRSQFSAEGAVSEAFSGATMISYLHDFKKHFEERSEAFTRFAQHLQQESFALQRLTLTVTGNVSPDIQQIEASFPMGVAVPVWQSYPVLPREKIAFRIPAQVNFAAEGMQLQNIGAQYDGTMSVAAHILSFTHLWNQVRVQGGAYGCGMQIKKNGLTFLYSYRDPTPDRTLQIFRDTANALRAFAESGETLDKYIIASIAARNPLMTPREEGAVKDSMDFCGNTDEERRATRQEALQTRQEDLLRMATLLEKMQEQSVQCVVGYQDALEKCPELTIQEL